METGNKITTMISWAFIALLLFQIIPVRGDSWEETFDTPTAIENWDVRFGTWYVDNGVLTVNETEYVNAFEGEATSIWHSQTEMAGTWSFEILHTGEEDFGTLFYFIGYGINPNQLHPSNGYVIHIWGSGNIDLDYVGNCCYRYSPGSYKATEPPVDWQHIAVSRNLEGETVVFLNGMKIITASHNLVTSSDYINIQTETLGVKFDNIRYSDEINDSNLITASASDNLSSSTPSDSSSNSNDTNFNYISSWLGIFFTIYLSKKIKLRNRMP